MRRRFHFNILFLLLGLVLFGSVASAKEETAGAGRYRIDPQHSEFLVHPMPVGFLDRLWQNLAIAVLDFSGQIRFDPNLPKESSLKLEVKTASLSVNGKLLERDKLKVTETMHDEILHTDTYPKITFESTKVLSRKTGNNEYEVEIWGDLDLHGVTRNVPIQTRIQIDKGVLKALGKVTIKQSDFKIKPFCAVGHALKVRDDIELSFDITAPAGGADAKTLAKKE